MAAIKTDGNCYICGKTLGKTAMKNHILKDHASNDGEECFLLKIEGAHAKKYWLFVDVEKNKPLSKLDQFMREIWLECCGHLSAFQSKYGNIAKTRKFDMFSVGDKLIHEYDMGSTTECLITFVGEVRRPKQKEPVRLLARNVPPAFKCVSCGKPADFFCEECVYDMNDPYYCEACDRKHEHDSSNPITNSPRSGVCGYEGELDIYEFDPGNF